MRPFTKYLFRNYSTGKITGAEIGVKKGENASNMLACLKNIEHLYLIDRWTAYTINEALPLERKAGYLEQKSFDNWKRSAYKLIGNNTKVIIMEMDSVEAAKQLYEQEIKLDFVYIDAAHGYEFVLRDCNTWLPLIKKGGVLGGHDFNHPKAPSVAEAAKDFAASIEKHLQSRTEDWWIQL